jgi:uncharacterized protein YcbX
VPIISELMVYPIKSCRGMPLLTVSVEKYGLQFDRQMMLVRVTTGEFISQRTFSQLALVRVSVFYGNCAFTVSGPGMSPYTFSLKFPENSQRLVHTHNASLSFMGHEQEEGITKWFCEYLGMDCRLIAVAEKDMLKRQIENFDEPVYIACSDSSPVSIISEASLGEFNKKLEESGQKTVKMDRFRPNIIVRGIEPFEEDTWSLIKIGGIYLKRRKRTPRCTVINIEQETAEKTTEVLATLASFRKVDGEVVLGSYFVPVNLPLEKGLINVNQKIEVCSRISSVITTASHL